MSEAPTKFSEYTTIPEMDEPVFHPNTGGNIGDLPPSIGGNIAHVPPPGHKNAFSSVSSQMTVESQQMLTPYSQQQTPSQQHQQQQHLDKLSMDVMMHTQLSGASIQGGITSLIPKFNPAKNVKTTDGKPHLDRADLKELDVDEIDLEKQRIRLMIYEQQKQEKESSKPAEDMSCHRSEPLDLDPLEDEDKEEHLSIEQMKQELESLDMIVSDQKRRYREIKMAREREEQSLKKAEKDLFTEISPNDQHQWHVEQKRRLREREKLKSEQNERLKHLQNNEHKAKNRLKALEAQTAVIRQQLQKAEAVKGFPQDRSPTQAKRSVGSSGGFKGGYDVFPSKLPSDDRPRGQERTVDQSAPSNMVEWDLGGLEGSKSITARVMSVESMSTAMTFDQPEIARELATTISASVLTEPTQDDSCPSKGPPCGYSVRPVSGGYLHSDDFFSTKSHSRNTLITEPDDIFLNQDERLRREHPQSMATIESVDSSLPSLRSMDDSGRDFIHGHQPIRGYPQLGGDEMQQQLAFRRTSRLSSSGVQSSNQVSHAHEQAWSSSKQHGVGVEREVPQNDQTSAHYDVPADARAAYQRHHQQQPSSNRQHGRHHRPRATSASRNQSRAVDLPSLDRPVQDAPQLLNGTSGGAPDVVPVSYSPASPHPHLPIHTSPTPGIQQRHVTGSESVMAASVQPPRSPNYAVYDVPPSRIEREKFLGGGYSVQPSSPISVQPLSHQEPTNFALQYQMNSHVTGVPPSSPIAPADNIYDRPRSVALRPSHSPRSPGMNGPLYDIPASARRSAGYEGGGIPIHTKPAQQINQHSAVIREREGTNTNTVASVPVAAKSKSVSSHRYGVSKSGMGHSYSRGRPDQVQQIDKAKQYMVSRSYRQQSVGRNIQRQQTDL